MGLAGCRRRGERKRRTERRRRDWGERERGGHANLDKRRIRMDKKGEKDREIGEREGRVCLGQNPM